MADGENKRRRSDERFKRRMRKFRQDSARRAAARRKAFKDLHSIALTILKILNRQTTILERIDRKLGRRA